MSRCPVVTLAVSLALGCDLSGEPGAGLGAAGTAASAPDQPSTRANDCGGLHYGNTAKPLAERYCLRCHRTPLVIRPGEIAPTGLDDEPSWLEHGGHALELLRAGVMPLSPPRPTPEEIARLTQWLACEDAHRPHGH